MAMNSSNRIAHAAVTPLLLLLLLCADSAFHPTAIPPLLDVPAFSLSTLGPSSDSSDDNPGTSSGDTMNVLTYASPVSIRPHRVWSISLYKGTQSHANFVRERRGILQMLRPEHAARGGASGEAGELVRVLGGTSGADVEKRSTCAGMGYAWEKLPRDDDDDAEWPDVLPSCAYYLKLELEGEMIDCGSHELALCRVVAMFSGEEVENAADELDSLSTRRLREDGIISELGRVVPLDADE